jgi:hypothetical protein
VIVRRFEPVLLVLALVVGGCQSTALPQASTVLAGNDCTVVNDSAAATIRFGIAQTIQSSNAPLARNGAEALVYRQLYETLVRVDCAGRVVPGLAESWSTAEDGRVWRFRLRAGAIFWDGGRVTAQHVIDSWQRAAEKGAHATRTFAQVSATSERDVQVELHVASTRAELFAQPQLAVAHPVAARWPLGSGPFRPDSAGDAAAVRIVRHGAGAAAPQSVDFRVVDRAEPRTLLDLGVDALISGDPAVLEYARALRVYTATPLSWSRTYTLLTVQPEQAGASAHAAELARSVVSIETRPAAGPLWWEETYCAVGRQRGPAPTRAASRAIVFPEGDPIARAIAERLVAIAWPAQRAPEWLRSILPADDANAGPPIAQPLAAHALSEAMVTRRMLAGVVPWPRAFLPGCNPAVAGDDAKTPVSTNGLNILPLIDTRDYLIHRVGLGRVLVDGDGVIRFAGARR